MTVDEIWEDALVHFDEGSSGKYNSDGGALGKRIVNRVYREVCRDAKCGTRTSEDLTASTSSREIALPSGLILLERVLYKPDGYNRGYHLDRVKATNDYNDESSGPPSYYYQIDTSYIGLVPFPDQAYTIPIVYRAGPAAELTGTQTPSLVPSDWHHVIVYGTVYQLFRIDNGDDGEGARKWAGLYRAELIALKNYLNEGCNGDQYAGVI
jgi:hypothetical protein